MRFVEAFGSATAIALFVIAVACWELVSPDRRSAHLFGIRWTSNFALFAISFVLQVVIAPGLTLLTTIVVERSPVATALGAPGTWVHLALSVLILDALYYATHRIYHVVPLLWRIHAAHHSDIDLDFSTAVRHHPLETLLSVAALGVAGAALGCLPLEVAFYGGLATIVQLVAHANVRLPHGLERALSGIVVTPIFHQIHHSSLPAQTDSNYGQVFPFWDKLFRSFGGSTDSARGSVEFGLKECRDHRSQRVDRILLHPIQIGSAAVTRAE